MNDIERDEIETRLAIARDFKRATCGTKEVDGYVFGDPIESDSGRLTSEEAPANPGAEHQAAGRAMQGRKVATERNHWRRASRALQADALQGTHAGPFRARFQMRDRGGGSS